MGQRVAQLDWFETVILPHEPALRARLKRIAPRTLDVDDLVAEVLMRAYAAVGWSEVQAGRPYLFRIARNLLIDASRRDKIVSFDVMASLDLLQTDDRTRTGLEARDELRRLEVAIETLPIQCRRVFLARRVHDLSVPEIAEQMGLSVSTVEKHLTKAVARMAHAMAHSEEQDFGGSLVQHQRPAVNRGSRR